MQYTIFLGGLTPIQSNQNGVNGSQVHTDDCKLRYKCEISQVARSHPSISPDDESTTCFKKFFPTHIQLEFTNK